MHKQQLLILLECGYVKIGAMTNPYAEWFEQLREEYGEELKAMPLPEGLPEHLHSLIQADDQDAIQMMLKIAWQFGAQVGFAAGVKHGIENSDAHTEEEAKASWFKGGMKA